MILQLTIADEYDDNRDNGEGSIYISTTRPSLSHIHTADSDESKSFDVISGIISNDKLSLNSNLHQSTLLAIQAQLYMDGLKD